MAKKTRRVSALRRAGDAVKRLLTRSPRNEPAAPAFHAASVSEKVPASQARAPRRQADIPLDLLDRSYTPPRTSSKASFRSDGADHQRDQDFANGVADEKWNDEDRLTNKSEDPRIGTHGRTYDQEPARK